MTGEKTKRAGGLTTIVANRRALLAAGLSASASSLLRAAPALAQDSEESEESGRLDWLTVFGALHVAAAEAGAQGRGGVNFHAALDTMVTAGVITQEVADAFPSFLGALYTQYLTPDPNNASGATFSNTLGLTVYKVASTDDAKTARSALQSAFSGRPDSRELTEDDTGVAGFAAYLIESTYAGANGDVPANYVNGVSIFNDIVVCINGVGYDANPVELMGALASAARGQLRGVDAAGATFGELIVPNGQPMATVHLVVSDGQLIEQFEQSEESREQSLLFGDAANVDTHYQYNFVWQEEGNAPYLFGQSVWEWDDAADAERFVDGLPDLFAEIDPGQNVRRVFEEVSPVAFDVVAPMRALPAGATVSPEIVRMFVARFIWEAQEGFVVGGSEVLLFYGDLLWTLSLIRLEGLIGDNFEEDFEDWLDSEDAQDLMEDLLDAIEDVTGVDPVESPDIVPHIPPEAWEQIIDRLQD